MRHLLKGIFQQTNPEGSYFDAHTTEDPMSDMLRVCVLSEESHEE